jgi:hypothetical protein
MNNDEIDASVAKNVLGQLTRLGSRAAPKGSACPQCESESMTVTQSPMGGPYSGIIRCDNCDYRSGLMAHIGREMFKVEPLPDGAKPIYTRHSPGSCCNVISGTFIMCGEGGNYCSSACQEKAEDD